MAPKEKNGGTCVYGYSGHAVVRLLQFVCSDGDNGGELVIHWAIQLV